MTGSPMPVRATSSPKIALIKVDLPTPVLPKIARLNRPSAAFCFSYSVRNESRNQSVLPAIGRKGTGEQRTEGNSPDLAQE